MPPSIDVRTPCLLSAALCLLFAGCDSEQHAEITRDELQALPVAAPAPVDDPLTAQKVELGRLLFWDPILSGDEDVACATCHHPDFGYGDGLALSIGVGGVGLGPDRVRDPNVPLVPRNAPTVLNTGFNGWVDVAMPPAPAHAPMFWDNREQSLEAQALGPIRSDLEMRAEAYPEDEAVARVVERIAGIPEYVALFAEAFGMKPEEAVNEENLARAIAAFERHLSQPNSAYDRWLAGDDSALSASQRRGLDAFHGVGCAECHGGPMFSDFEPHNIGVPDPPGMEDVGTGGGRFRTPTLRNIALTGPYMHNGTIEGLREAVAFYDDGDDDDGDDGDDGGDDDMGQGAGEVDPLVEDIELDEQDVADIAAFLEALTDDFDVEVPTEVPSGLPPGGAIGG